MAAQHERHSCTCVGGSVFVAMSLEQIPGAKAKGSVCVVSCVRVVWVKH